MTAISTRPISKRLGLFAAQALIGTMLSSGAFLLVGTASAQQADSAAVSADDHGMHHDMKHWDPTAHIEGRLAFLKTELKITSSQEANWDKVADLIRKQASDRKAAMVQHQSDKQSGDLIQVMEDRAKAGAAHAAAQQAFLAAFKPLYASFSDDQKKTAGELFSHHFHH